LQEAPSFAIRGLRSGEKRTVFFRDVKRQLAALCTFEAPAQGKPQPKTVRMEPTGAVSGRLVDGQGRPMSQWHVGALSRGGAEWLMRREVNHFSFGQTTTDADGYFRLPGIPSGVVFEIVTYKDDLGREERPRLAHSGQLRGGE